MSSLHSSKKFIFLLVLSGLLVGACGGGGGGGGNGNGISAGQWLIPEGEVVDGGPGPDGIPALDHPPFEAAATITTVEPDDMVVAIRYQGQVKVYPHDILDYHEIVNDGTEAEPFSLSYCPLTDSAVAWEGSVAHADPSFGTSGLLYNANLILYDRETESLWSQMKQQAVNGPRIRETARNIQVLEMKFAALQAMYPDAVVMTRDTGHTRDYDDYPYGAYKTSGNMIFLVSPSDIRMFPKHRIVGIYSGSASKVYQVSGFGSSFQVINDQFENQSIVAVGNSDLNFAVIYDRRLPDGTILTFEPIQNDLPNIMMDTEGNVWDAFGTAVSGPRAGAQLSSTKSFKSMWFAFAAFYPDPEIHFN